MLVVYPGSGATAELTFQVQKSCIKAGVDLQGTDLTATLNGAPRALIWSRVEDSLSLTFTASDGDPGPGQHTYEVKANLGDQTCSSKQTFGSIVTPDAAVPEAGVDSGSPAPDAGPPGDDGGGCAWSAGSPPAGPAALPIALLALAVLAGRRRAL